MTIRGIPAVEIESKMTIIKLFRCQPLLFVEQDANQE